MSDSAIPDSKHLLTLVKQLEQEIELSHERTSLILSTMPVALMLVKTDGTIEVTNRLVEDMFGYSRKELFAKPIADLFIDLKLDSKIANQERFARRANGEQFPTQISVARVPTPDGERTFVFILDISERHRIEKMRRDFVAMISHDLRTPLANASGVLELGAAGKFGEISPQLKEELGRAETSLNRVISMISQLLEVEKLEDETMAVELRTANLTATVREAKSEVLRLAEAKHIEIHTWEESLFARYDRERTHRVLVNLLANAIKFSAEQASITVSYSVSAKWIELAVEDSGRGVPPENRESIFSKYAQVARTDNTEKGGVGLGLAICKAIVEAHGGAIGVRDSRNGTTGCTFWFTLPVAEE